MSLKTEQEVIVALRQHFNEPEYALLPQVRNQTGFARRVRTADALVMGLWPSRGIYLHGIEIKVSRADWMHEKNSPEKAEEIAKFCDFWWLAVGDRAIAKIEEVPVDWGVLAPDDHGKMRVIKQAVKRGDVTPISRPFLAAMIRKLSECKDVFADVDGAIQKQVDLKVAEAKKTLKATVDWEVERKAKDYDKLKSSIDAFEKASGVQIDRYSDYWNTEIGGAVAAIRQAGKDLSITRKFEEAENVMLRAAKQLRQQRSALELLWAQPRTVHVQDAAGEMANPESEVSLEQSTTS